MTSTFSGIIIDSNDEQQQNAATPMDDTLFGIVRVLRDEQPKNNPSLMKERFLERDTDVSDVQSEKAFCPIDVTLSGVSTVVSDVHPLNA